MKDYSKMLWDSTEPFPFEIAEMIYLTAINPRDMFERASESHNKDSIEYYFWTRYFGADFQNPTLPDYLNEISNIDRNTRRIFSIIAFALLDKTILERLIESNINQLKGSIRIDDFDPLIIDSLILRAYSDDSFLYTGRTIAFNYEKLLSNSLFGKCLMNLLCSRLRYSLNEPQQVSFNDLLDACFELKFHKALGLSETTFKLWLKGLTGGMLWDSTEALTKSENIAELFSHTAAFPEEMFTMAHQSYNPIEYDFWEHYFGADFSNPTPPLYLFEIRDIDREARMLFSIIAFVLLDIDILEHLIKSNIKQLKGRVRIDDFNRLKSVSLFGISDSFNFVNEGKGKYVEFNLEKIMSIQLFGKCLMNLLNSRLRNFLDKSEVSFDELMKKCYEHKFHKALGLARVDFSQWLKGTYASTGDYINTTQINNFICIDNAILDFSNSKAEPSKEIYLLGENGDGKTLVLEALLMTYAKERIKYSAEDMGNAYKLFKKAKAEGASLKGEDDKKIKYGNGFYSVLPKIFAYGTHRGRTNGRKQDFDDTGFLTLFDTNKILTDPSEWIKDFCTKGLGSIDLLSFEEYQVNNNVAQERLKELQELFDIILNKKINIKTNKDGQVRYIEHGADLTFDQLSEGYRSTLIFICDLLYRLFNSQSENEKEETIEHGRDANAVVLIDEIDAHLHPRWQREIVNKMRKVFPNVQFIMTTHSPFIIQGASDDALIFRLFRENGKTCVSEPIKRSELDYMMINTLATSPIFGMGSARLSNDENIDYTSKSFLMERIEKLVIDKIKDEKKRTYLSEEEINKMIEDAWSQIDTNDNDKEQPL